MSDFKRLSNMVLASPQITIEDVDRAKALGIGLIINNRPDGESDDQTEGAKIETAAREAGIAYCAIPITHAGFSQAQVEAMESALAGSNSPVLAYCRSGTRSTLLWSLVQAKIGQNPDEIASAASSAGYDISPIRSALDFYAAASSA